jgi:hypothetical protein
MDTTSYVSLSFSCVFINTLFANVVNRPGQLFKLPLMQSSMEQSPYITLFHNVEILHTNTHTRTQHDETNISNTG